MTEFKTKTEYSNFTTTISEDVELYKGRPFLHQFSLSELQKLKFTSANVWHTIDMLMCHMNDYKEQCIRCTKCSKYIEKSQAIVYNCGHTFCKSCNRENKEECPECLNKITQRIQINN